MKSHRSLVLLLAAALGAAPAVYARTDAGPSSPLKPAIEADEKTKKGLQEAADRLSLAERESAAAARTLPEAASVLEELRALVAKSFLPRLADSHKKASSSAKDMAGFPPLCAGANDLAKLRSASAGADRLGKAVEETGRVNDELKKATLALDSRLRALAQGLLSRKENARALEVDRVRLEVRGDLLKAWETLEKVLKNKPKVDLKGLMADCLKDRTPKAMPIPAPAKNAEKAAALPAKAVLSAAALAGRGGAAASTPAAAVRPAASPAPAAKALQAQAKPQDKGLQIGERLLESGKSLLGIGTGLARDLFGMAKEVPVNLAKDLWNVGGKLVKGDIKGAAEGVGGAAVNALGRVAGGATNMLARTLLGAVDIVDVTVLGKPLPRSLTAEEKGILGSVYGSSVDLDKVRVRVGSTSHLALPAHAIGNNIYFPEELGSLKNSDGTLTWDGRTLTHETGHVWQDQNGDGDYLSKAAFANAHAAVTQGDRNKAYEWKGAAAQGVPFSKLNPEQQATVIDALAADDLRPADDKWLNAQETEYARKAMELVRAGRGAP
jgi:hypothetical protein